MKSELKKLVAAAQDAQERLAEHYLQAAELEKSEAVRIARGAGVTPREVQDMRRQGESLERDLDAAKARLRAAVGAYWADQGRKAAAEYTAAAAELVERHRALLRVDRLARRYGSRVLTDQHQFARMELPGDRGLDVGRRTDAGWIASDPVFIVDKHLNEEIPGEIAALEASLGLEAGELRGLTDGPR